MKKIKIIPTKPNSELILNIDVAKKNIPDWYKKSPQKIKGLEQFSLIPNNPLVTTSTYKKCSPFLDALSDGYIFSLSQDVEVLISDEGTPFLSWRPAGQAVISNHTENQWEGLPYPDFCHAFIYKWENTFVIKTPKGYSTLFTQPHNRFDLPFQIISGIVDTDKYNLEIHFPFFIKKNFTGIIKAGTPLVQMTFFKREHWYRKVLKYNRDFVNKSKMNFFAKIDRSYKNQIWQKKNYD
jgi:hypothetical protein